MSKRLIGEIVSFWNYHEDGYYDNWYDTIGILVGYEPVEITQRWGVNTVLEMPIFKLADGSKYRYNNHKNVPIFSKELFSKVTLEKKGEGYEFVRFITHKDSETNKDKDYLYEFKNIVTGEVVVLKPQIHNTLKFIEFKDFFGLELKDSWILD